nr:cytochrome c oxidase subunit 3 [Arcuatula senhousia]WPW47626.1 cytochrome c oxidase subunit 3 [Arcuatula senhousia]WPW47638.1 cytochrome c oxidase subunit 3 [Arcuatula senhousia]
MARNPFNYYYVPGLSPWPFLVALNIGSLCLSLVMWMHRSVDFMILLLPVLGVLLCLLCWWRNLLDEVDLGFHNRYVVKTYRDGVAIFIFSEAMMFFSLFWAFLYSSESPSASLDLLWPPLGVRCPKPFSTALFSTGLLISSSFYCVWAHKAMYSRDYSWAPIIGVAYSVLCGAVFLRYQFHEYYMNSFSMADSVFGSCFYILTGFHGFHVVIGSLWLLVSMFRLILGHFSRKRHFGLVACFWYWHFVDVVWVFVWLLFYLVMGGWLFEKWMAYKGLEKFIIPSE